jgi:hypothetical protein
MKQMTKNIASRKTNRTTSQVQHINSQKHTYASFAVNKYQINNTAFW